MPVEECASCGAAVSLSDAVHLLVHTKSEAGVVDHYVCRQCYEDRIAVVFE